MARKIRQATFDSQTGNVTVVEIDEVIKDVDLETHREQKLVEAYDSYKGAKVLPLKTSVFGEEMTFSYSEENQAQYTKWATVLALDTSRQSITLGSLSHGVIQVTRDQFMLFMNDAENREMTLYLKRKELEQAITLAQSADEINNVIIDFS